MSTKLTLIAALAACSGGSRGTPPHPAAPVEVQAPALSLAALDDLMNTPGAPTQTGATPIETYRATIRDRLTRPEFYDAFVPTLLKVLDVHQLGRPIMTNDVLAQGTGADGKPYLFVDRIGDCKGKGVTRVKPWWALESEVSVCTSSIRADVTTGEPGVYCEASAWPLPACGCGPNLINCAPTRQWRKVFALQARQEVQRTVREIVTKKLPYASILTMQDSVRSSLGEFWYARSAFFQGQPLQMPRIADDNFALLPDAMNDYELRPRRPEHRGGLLTMPMFLFADGSRRVASQNLWNDFLCVDWSTASIDPHVLVDLASGSSDIRVGANPKLIETPVCKECHRRLEYPVLALDEFTNFFKGGRYVPRSSPMQTKLYVKGSTDLRATFDANAFELGKHIVEQPEFHTCAVDKVLEYAYQGYPVPDTVRARLVDQFSHGEDLGALIENALLARTFGPAAVAEGAR